MATRLESVAREFMIMVIRKKSTANNNDYHYISLVVIDSEIPALLVFLSAKTNLQVLNEPSTGGRLT